MINLTTSVVLVNISRWKVLSFDINGGRVVLQFLAPPATLPFPPFIDKLCLLSDVANNSTGVTINPSPQGWDDKIISVGPAPNGIGGVGAASSLSNAQAAYATAYAAQAGGPTAKHNAGLKAVEVRALTDGWVPAALGGT